VNPRVAWADLPAGLRGRLEEAAGTFVRAEQVSAGHNCLIGMILHTTSGQWFLKGVLAGHPRAAWTHANEAAINPWVAPVTAPLKFRVQDNSWDVLGFGYLAGHRHADLAPGSPDLPAIAAALQALAAIPAPRTVQLRAIEDRWREYIGDRAALLAGPAIAHTDLHRHNIMIGPSAKLIDWAWPTLAAPWVDTACVGLQLITAGHHPAAAEHWCQQLPAYHAARREAITAFADAARAMWHEIAAHDPQPWKHDVAAAAGRWARHRAAQPS